MRSTTHRLTWAGAIVIGALALMPRAYAEESDKAALAAALAKVATTLEKGLQASEKIGKPISAKFEIEDGKLQLSIYTVAPAGFTEVIVALDSGGVASSEKITDADDLKAASAQNAARCPSACWRSISCTSTSSQSSALETLPDRSFADRRSP